MVRPLYNELQYRNESEKNCEALRRIVQAELMGQFYKLKYFAGDLKQEIHYPIQEAREDVWKQNLSLTRLGLMAKEVDDFYHTIRMGELPHFTCLSCYQGSQRDCLLAAFDSNKKIILVYKDESVVARACLRLTKGSFQQPSTLNFEFADLSKEDVPTGSHAYSEKLVLFLEHIYTSGLKKSEETAAKEMVVALATQKAEELDAVAVLSNQYRGCYPSGRYVSALRLEPYRDGLLLEALETAPEQRRKGFAAALIRAVQCFLEGKTKLYSHVDKRNLSSLKVHEKCGFRIVSEQGYDYLHQEADDRDFGLEYRYERP